ncbi:MAG: hypothetical protein HYZ81_06775, partial [Nitrospinae bacterium]|nr:hypothetical protein [Nitrospinota bacterium]
LLVLTMAWLYFTFAEYLTTYYGNEPTEMAVFWAKVSGPYAPYFWAMAVTNFVIPFIILANWRTRTIAGTVIASLSVSLGMWLERFTIVVPTLVNPRLPLQVAIYQPTWVEWSIMAGDFAMFVLLYLIFSKLFPIVSIWEIREGREHGVQETLERLRRYLPGGETEMP